MQKKCELKYYLQKNETDAKKLLERFRKIICLKQYANKTEQTTLSTTLFLLRHEFQARKNLPAIKTAADPKLADIDR